MMRRITVGLSCINTTVGAVVDNTDKIIQDMNVMAEGMRAGPDDPGCHISFFQEMGISGYPAEDLVQWADYVDAQDEQLGRICDASREWPDQAFVVGLAHRHRDQIYNCLALVCDGYVRGFVPKQELPNYGVFYDGRVFSPGSPGLLDDSCIIPFGDLIFEFPWGTVGLAICEDMWRDGGPIAREAFSGAELILNASASPYRVGVADTRKAILRTRSADAECCLAYVNQVGGNDALPFDGGAYVYQNGSLVHETPRFVENCWGVTVDLDQTARGRIQNTTWRRDAAEFVQRGPVSNVVEVEVDYFPTEAPDDTTPEQTIHHFLPAIPEPYEAVDHIDEMVSAITMGLDGYYRKTGAFNGVCIALSGGRDSMLTALLVRDWTARTEANRDTVNLYDASIPVRCYSMPSKHNSDLTKGLAATLCEQLDIEFHEVPIQDAYEAEMAVLRTMVGTDEITPLTLQNAQARIRAMRMWNISNQTGMLWMQCGNMSEKASGYTTIGGDLMGGYSLLGNIPKTVVNEMLEHYKWQHADDDLFGTISLLLESTASAELADDQQDERDLMPFEILDACYALFAGEKRLPQDVYDTIAAMHTEKSLKVLAPNYQRGMLKGWVTRFVRLFFRNVFKWEQATQSVHLYNLDLDRKRALQIPVVQSLQWLNLEIEGDL